MICSPKFFTFTYTNKLRYNTLDDKIAIKVSNVSKKYSIGKQKDSSLRGSLAGFFQSAETKGDDFWATNDISFEIKKGEALGIIGKNGAGKSTLLKILSQITKPTEGRIEINGRVASLLEVGTGFHPELTGRENIYLNGTILGMTRKEVKAKFEEIVAFSGVEKFIDTPVKHYSSGMYVRLAFAVAAHLEPEILIIDEVLAVGDLEFQEKCLGKMQEVTKGHGRTVIFVSHQLGMISKLCPRSIFLEKGRIKMDGPTSEVIREYLKSDFRDDLSSYTAKDQSKDIFIQKIKLNKDTNQLLSNESIEFIVDLNISSQLSDLKFGIGINNNDLNRVFTTELTVRETTSLLMKIPAHVLTPGKYYLTAGIHMPNVTIYDQLENIIEFEIVDHGSDFAAYDGANYGNVFVDCKWEKL